MKKTNILYAAVLSLGLLSGCNDNILDLNDPNRYTEASYYKTLDECKAAVLACYSWLTVEPGYCRTLHYAYDLMSGQATPTTRFGGSPFAEFTYRKDEALVSNIWNAYYVMNFRSLNAIEKVGAWEAKTEDEKKEKQILLGEAHFFHAWAYYYLTQLWGDVPYHPTFDSNKSEYIKPRTSYKDIEDKLIVHLNDAVNMLPEKYEDSDLGRIPKAAARMLLAKIYLGQGKYKEAETQLTQIKGYDYHDNYFNLFTNGNHTSKEIIMEVIHWYFGSSNGSDSHFWGNREDKGAMQTTFCRSKEYGFNDWWNFYISEKAAGIMKYDITTPSQAITGYVDPRTQDIMYGDGIVGDNTFAAKTSDGKDDVNNGVFAFKPYDGTQYSGYAWKKYQYYEEWAKNDKFREANMATVIMRYADARLLLAEAYIGQENYTEALKIINEVRTRQAVNAEPYKSMDASNAFEILKRERYIELYGEQQYIFDIIRWDRLGKLDMIEELERVTTFDNIDPRYKKFPIPQSELDTNPLIETSDGWN